MTARGGPQVMRLACIYALLGQSHVIDVEHLDAAYAVWQYSAGSVRYIFGDALGDPMADTLLRALRSNHAKSDVVSQALTALSVRSLARCESVPTEGRSQEVWHAIRTPYGAKEAKESPVDSPGDPLFRIIRFFRSSRELQ
jgi:hypothetical protein